MNPVLLSVDDLKPHPKNSRTHSSAQITAIARAIKEWGFYQPVVVDEDHTILIGHGRVEAARALGLAEVPALVRTGLSDEKKRAMLISDNRLAELGSRWDDALLSEELRYLLGSDYDVTLTAFELAEVGDAREPVERKAPPPVTVPGDVWRLGRHRLVCGDARDKAVVKAACGQRMPIVAVTEMIETDPEAARIRLGEFLQWISVPVLYVWHQPSAAVGIADAMHKQLYEVRSQLIHPRPEMAKGKRYRRQHDPCWYGVKLGKANGQGSANWQGGRTQSTVWYVDGEGRGGLPVALWQRGYTNHTSRPGEVVFDPFARDGNGLIAAQRTGRDFCGAEADPGMVDRAVQRWQTYAAQEAINEATGQPFGDH